MESDELKQLKPGTLLKTIGGDYHKVIGFKKADTIDILASDTVEIPLGAIVMFVRVKMVNVGIDMDFALFCFVEVLTEKEIALVEPNDLEKV